MRLWRIAGCAAALLLAPCRTAFGASPDRVYPRDPIGTAFVEQFKTDRLDLTPFHPARPRRYWDSRLDETLVGVIHGGLVVTGRVPNGSRELPRVGGVVSRAYYRPGRLTVRAKANLPRGLVATVHFYNEDGDRDGGGRREEIDLELSSDTPTILSWDTYHDDDGTNELRQNAMHRGDFCYAKWTRGLQGFDSRGFNTYAIDWRADQVTWFVNDVQIAKAVTAIPTAPMQIRIDLYHSRQWDRQLGLTPSGTGTLEVDWVQYEPAQ